MKEDEFFMDQAGQQRGSFEGGNGSTEPGYRYSRIEPDILPPDGRTGGHETNPQPYYVPAVETEQYQGPGYQGPGYGNPPPSGPRRRTTWAFAPATYTLLGINCAVFLCMLLAGVSIISPTPEQLLRFGANYGPAVLLGGEWWRLITAMFVHVGIIHIATNMWCLWNLGLLAEPLMGPMGVVAAYVLTGFAGNLLSIAVHPGVANGSEGIVGAGASGAIFGLAGVLILLLKSPLLPLPKEELKRLRWSVIQFSILNFGIGLYTAFGKSPVQIDNMAHLGGFLSGLALGVPLVPRIGAPRELFKRRRLMAVAGIGFLLVLIAFGLHSFWRPA
ncbi:rhomboid protease GluP [Silvibacterium bohemicum]|uniref:Rhomboid protease GluP n=2 Tax=Silvibacterium bohemicum TaxID=1577686 RepID=A0A841JNE3_9BACT|nr:rhomboid protease GluP [Silvibacterium bohemicum]